MSSELYIQGDNPRRMRIRPAREALAELEREEKRRRLEQPQTAEEQVQETPKTQPIILPAHFNPEDYILLSGRTHGVYSYPDLFVSMHRMGMNPEVEQAGRQLGYSLSDSAKEKSGRDYIGDINWKQALTLNLTLGGLTLSPRQFEDFLLLLKSGNAVNATGRKIPESKLAEILNEITEVRAPYRAEHLDADFKYLDINGNPAQSDDESGKLWLYSSHVLRVGNLEAEYRRILEPCLMTKGDKVDLSIMNEQGMPLPLNKGNDFYYWCSDKDNKSVAGFDAYSDGASFSCFRHPGYLLASLGVRRCLSAEGAQKNNSGGGN